MRNADVIVLLTGVVLFGASFNVSADVAEGNLAVSDSQPLLVAQVEQGAQKKKEKKAKKKKAKRECRRVRVTGSRVKERVCKKPEEWERIDHNVRENVDRAFEGSTRNTGGGDS